jgi:FKBP-type peptidyl-prolyl cis-trans isomerase FkpA
MKKYFLMLSLIIIGVSSCKKSSFDSSKQAATDDALIKAYISANNITATKDPSGLYYSVVTPGTGAYPTISSTVNVNYTGKLLDGTVFAPPANASSPLTGFIKGWQIGIPHINTGGRILLLIPSALGYGNSSPGAGIPANAVLVFTVDLVNFSN